jgi:RHS repeat-associated protein
MDFDEWGNPAPGEVPTATPFGFAGASSALVRFGARDYDPASGRWVSKDPIRFEGGQENIYVYVANNPIGSFDASGRGDLSCVLCVAACTAASAYCVVEAAPIAVLGGTGLCAGSALECFAACQSACEPIHRTPYPSPAPAPPYCPTSQPPPSSSGP